VVSTFFSPVRFVACFFGGLPPPAPFVHPPLVVFHTSRFDKRDLRGSASFSPLRFLVHAGSDCVVDPAANQRAPVRDQSFFRFRRSRRRPFSLRTKSPAPTRWFRFAMNPPVPMVIKQQQGCRLSPPGGYEYHRFWFSPLGLHVTTPAVPRRSLTVFFFLCVSQSVESPPPINNSLPSLFTVAH